MHPPAPARTRTGLDRSRIDRGALAHAVESTAAGIGRPRPAPPGTIRGDYALVGLRNLVHASDAPETAAAEIALWFPDGVVAYTRDLERWMTDEGAPS